ncbi:hypothetical protein [Trichormus sp. NMC-1]|uniref:hypothetical protein n=1 Tax=Trichormus sp. NMC-1 TaxID=1853259 RepID=UPI0008DBEBA4|nr:hypothetical protein [Trichormus sp. NMC-1]
MNTQKIGFSPGKELKKLCDDIFNEIYPQIKKQKKGVLSTIIYIILEQEHSQAEQIHKYFQIENNASLEDDLSISADVIGLFISDPNKNKDWWKEIINDGVVQVKEIAKDARKKIGSRLESNDMKLFQIVVIGCLIVGTVSCLIYLKKKQGEVEKKSKNNTPSDSSPPPRRVPVSVALCLVVPAAVVRNLGNVIKDTTINVSDIETLIENASYFLCTSPEYTNAIQLKLTSEDIRNVSEQREIYIRIKIDDGGDMKGKKVPYILKRNLPSNGQGIVEKIACLEYLSVSGLEDFNRI